MTENHSETPPVQENTIKKHEKANHINKNNIDKSYWVIGQPRLNAFADRCDSLG
jgi:hypothetical protein